MLGNSNNGTLNNPYIVDYKIEDEFFAIITTYLPQLNKIKKFSEIYISITFTLKFIFQGMFNSCNYFKTVIKVF